MKKPTRKQRERDVQLTLLLRRKNTGRTNNSSYKNNESDWRYTNNWINVNIHKGLKVSIDKKRRLILHLPEIMNFFGKYDVTALHIAAIRKLTEKKYLPNKAYKLATVNFDNLKQISTSAALVLTAELSKWDDSVRQKLRPNIEKWDCDILKQFTELGFFDLFQNNPIENHSDKVDSCKHSSIKLVKYIKGRCGDKAKTRILKKEIRNIVQDNISKWTFLDSGLSEAITNVSHHAYPNYKRYYSEDKNWYLTGSYNKKTKELKIVFYDQGIGIPKSLPSSEVWERVLAALSKYPAAEKRSHKRLLRAAVELDRTSTYESDRGKGLQDLLEFTKHRYNGYLSIISLKGLFKYSIKNGKETVKTEGFDQEIYGTLIIWSIALEA